MGWWCNVECLAISGGQVPSLPWMDDVTQWSDAVASLVNGSGLVTHSPLCSAHVMQLPRLISLLNSHASGRDVTGDATPTPRHAGWDGPQETRPTGPSYRRSAADESVSRLCHVLGFCSLPVVSVRSLDEHAAVVSCCDNGQHWCVWTWITKQKTKKQYYFAVPCGKFRLPYLGKAQQLQERHCLFLLVSAVFL